MIGPGGSGRGLQCVLWILIRTLDLPRPVLRRPLFVNLSHYLTDPGGGPHMSLLPHPI